MKQVIIKREHAWTNSSVKHYCYIDNTVVCAVDDGEVTSVAVDSNTFSFRCAAKLNPSSKSVDIDLNGRNAVLIVIKEALVRPTVTLIYDYASVLQADQIPFFYSKIIGDYLAVDDINGTWTINDGSNMPYKDVAKHSYNDIKSVELVDDGDVITSGGLGGAIVGNLLFGGIGAIVGGIVADRKTAKNCTSLAVKVVLKDAPDLVIPLIEKKTNRDTPLFAKAAETAQAYMDAFQMLIDKQEKPVTPAASPAVSAADELRKFKSLMDDGIITEEEFQAKKKQLLGL